MDWETFYEEADYDVCAYVGGEDMAPLLARFLDRVEPGDVASVGCGPAVTLYEVAERYPDVRFVGYDVSETVVADNRDRAAERGLDNLSFAVDALPDLATDRQFDLVYCMAVLYFVEQPERALRSLYDRVRPGGHLVVNYPNRYSQARFDREFEGRKREALELVIEGRNLLTYERIHDVLGRWPRSYWTAVDARDAAFANRSRPTVYVPK